MMCIREDIPFGRFVHAPFRTLSALAAVLVCLQNLTYPASGATGQRAGNLLPNGSFEEQAAGRPAGWNRHVWAGKGTLAFSHASFGRTGSHCLCISSSGKGADAGWSTIVAIDPFTTYRLSGWIKTENVEPTSGLGALLNLHNMQRIRTPAVTGTRDWTRVEVVFDADGNDFVEVNCLFGGWGLATGTAWFDDLRLEPLSSRPWEPRLEIDAHQAGQPVSKYIYGQFIEHLGRCIYGGIWAEMLEDRKFFYPVGSEQSPWQPLKPGTVQMLKPDAFVGEHSPRLAAGSGIRQRRLGLTKSKRYVGYVWLKAADGQAAAEVSLAWGQADRQQLTAGIEPVAGQYRRYPLAFTAGATTDDGVLTIRARRGACLVGTVSLMPADNVAGMRADTLKLLRELDSPIYRWPGGNFVSGYNWRDGIGPRDRRPPRKNPAWKGIEHNDFGFDEFMTFCRLVGAEPYVVVNSGLGEVASAVQELEYANGSTQTPMGKLRAQNGHPKPYRVKWWGIGNEMYGHWQLGHMPLADYVRKHNRFAEAMRAKDPSIKLIAVGNVGPWSEGMMQHCADHMDLISEHFYRGRLPGLAAHVRQIPDQVRRIADAHRRYRQRFASLKGKDIRIALDEWNYWYGPHVYGELGVRYHLQDALGIAAGLHEYVRNSDIYFMANYAQTVNVIGCVKTTKRAAAFATTGLVLKLYRQQFGTVPVAAASSKPLDVAAALTSDRKALTVGVVNPTTRHLTVPLTVRGVNLSGRGQRWQIAGNDPMAYNEPGRPPQVRIEESPVSDLSAGLPVAPCSVTLYRLELE